ncbi:MAG: SAM-dependent DNA methyltransferase, partial [Armatimonadetes bacterium]|nr:SAM-dependent DNA methyltransferase [Armatimonadota bacterium]
QSAFAGLTVSRKKDPQARADEEAAGRAQQQALLDMLATLPTTLFTDREAFVAALAAAEKGAKLKFAAPVRKALLAALSERDETAAICRDKDGNPEPDPDLRDTENVPLGQAVDDYFAREVTPHVPDAWVSADVRDPKDALVGKVGYEINFNRYFYQYVPPRPLAEIEADIKAVEEDILRMLREVAD